MKILELCLSDGKGGLELYVYRSAKELVQRGCECLAVVGAESFLHKKMIGDSVPCITLKSISYKLPIFSAIKLAAIVQQHNIDIIHVHWGKDLFLASLAKRLSSRSVKLVYTRQMTVTRAKKDLYHRFVYAKVDLYISITDELKRLAQSFLPMPTENIIRLYYGVKCPNEMDSVKRNKLRSSWFIDETKHKADFIVGIVGRIEEQKGQALLIDAVKILQQHNNEISLIVVGPPMHESYLISLQQKVQELGMSDSVVFIGSHANPMDIMGAMDCLVLATRKETFGLVLVEAMRAKVPVLGSAAGGVPEIIDHKHTGLLFESDNVADLSKQLQSLMSDNNFRKKIAEAGKQKADKEFCHDVHYDKLIKIFSDLLDS